MCLVTTVVFRMLYKQKMFPYENRFSLQENIMDTDQNAGKNKY